jgi:hypothetical protein
LPGQANAGHVRRQIKKKLRALKAKAITSRAMADALMLALSKLIETAPDVAQQKELRIRVCEHLERITKGNRSLH